ncbi:sperm microtubule inner protein 8-like [Dysidea avara]|uniref:sperm microtubule inner protein 8-like n=1 Tax=Dysidea avara TaxID=196820 RepID=UPI003317A1AD
MDDSSTVIAKLAGLKQGLYHPRLPTLRKMDMDTMTHKLPTEHARTTTTCPPDDFSHAVTTLRWSSAGRLHSGGVINKTISDQLQCYRPLGHIDAWQSVVDRLKAQEAHHSMEDIPQPMASGYIGRYKHPGVTSSWQHAMKRPQTARPMPATMYSRYRGSTGIRPQSARPWRH